MKATELRIGNLLQRLDGGVFNVTIHDLHIIHLWDSSEKLLPNPIPLTEEWLLKLGFEYNQQFFWKNYGTNGVHTINYVNFYSKYVLQLGKGMSITLDYVHQLQNLFHALTGEELTLNQ